MMPVSSLTVYTRYIANLSVSSLFLSFPVQHSLMVTLQADLERLCYQFGQKNMPQVLQDRGWDCAERVQLCEWMDVFRSDAAGFAGEQDGQMLETIFNSVTEIGENALRRTPVGSGGLQKLLLDAQALCNLLDRDTEYVRKLQKLQKIIQEALSNLDEKKRQLQSQLEVKRSRIERERASLVEEEKAAVGSMRRTEEIYQDEIRAQLGQEIEHALDDS